MSVLETLRRWPDVEADNLVAVDAADRYLLDTAATLLPGRTVTVIGDNYGALTLGALAAGADRVRVHQDAMSGELALANNSAGASGFSNHALDESLVAGSELVLARLPRSLDALDELAQVVASFAAPSVQLISAGRIKHMHPNMNRVLNRHFERVEATRARQKSRLLMASGPIPNDPEWPKSRYHEDIGLWVWATGAAFGGTAIDPGTRLLLGQLEHAVPDAAEIVDLGCGTGIIAAALARARPRASVTATDQSAAAVASARLTMQANELDVAVVRDDGLASRPAGSADLVVLNPPFHIGSTVHTGIATKLFSHAARALRTGGELWVVWNSHLGYRRQLESIVGETRQVARDSRFTVTASVKR